MTLAAGWAVALGAVPLGAVFAEWRWIWYAWAAVGAVVAAHLLARSLRLPAAAVPVAGTLGLLLYLTLVFAADAALLGLVPTPGSVDALRVALISGLEDVNGYAAPVPATPGLVLLTAVSIGAVAIVVDVVAVAMRRPAAAGLALLALYAVPTAVVFDGVPWVLFAIGATGYLVLLLVEGRDRLLRWGRPVGASREEEDAALPLTGPRIGAAAIALAVIVPVLIPGVTSNALSRLGRSGTGDAGTGTGGSLNEFAALRGQLQRGSPVELMRVQTDLEQPFYLRTKVLDRYRSGGFASGQERAEDSVPGLLSLPANQAPISEQRTYQTTIALTDSYVDDHLPLYYRPTSVAMTDIRGFYGYDRDNAVIFGASGGDFTYTVRGVVPDPSAATLASVGTLSDEERSTLADSVTRPVRPPPVVVSTVAEITRGLGSDYLKAKAINDFFTDGTRGFTYALRTLQGNSGSVLVDFLTKKQGYCEQYAAAMAVMLREVRIPSRVVIGYTAGKRQDDGSYSVTTSDAHAWVEAYFSQVGWVTFDPTPLADGRTIGVPYAPRPPATPTAAATPTAGATGSGAPTANRIDPADLQTDTSGSSTGQRLVTPRRALAGVGVLAVVVLLLAPAVARLSARRRRLRTASGRDAAAAARAAWDEVVGTAADFGVPVQRTETPRALATRLGRELSLGSSATAGLRLVALAEERARYAPRAGVEGDLPTAVQAVRRGLRERADRRHRWQAALLPPSTVRAARYGSAARTATASSALSRLGQTVRRPVTPRRR